MRGLFCVWFIWNADSSTHKKSQKLLDELTSCDDNEVIPKHSTTHHQTSAAHTEMKMQTYLVKFADGIEVEVNADYPAHAQEQAIEYLESIGEVVHEIVSITRVTATPL